MKKIERIIITSKPIAFIIKQSKQICLPGFDGLPLYDVVIFFFQQMNRVGMNERAAAISFNFIMAIPAACIFLFTLVPYLPVSKMFTLELLKLTKDLTPNQNTYKLVSDFLNDFFNKPRSGLLSLGFLLAVFYSSNAMMGIIRTFDRSIHEYKGFFLLKRWRAIKLTFILFFLIIASIMILIGQAEFTKLIANAFHLKKSSIQFPVEIIRWLIIGALFFYSIGFIYKYAPSVKERWKIVSPGVILATFLIILATYLFSFWVNNFSNFNKIYGSIGTVLILMLLIYFNSLILLIGFELNVSITYLKSKVNNRLKEDAN